MSQAPRQLPPPPPPIRSRQTKTVRLSPRPALKHPPKSRANPVHVRHRRKQPIRRELSAGGVAVRQERGQWLVALLKTEHKRGPVWVLPKGHVELASNEAISDAAKREVQEEAGLKDLSVKDQLGITRFAFQAEDALVRKTVHYFLMVTGQKELTPQAEEGLLEAAWFPLDVAIATLAYDTDQDIVGRAKSKLLGIPVPSMLKT
ncbi:MAG: NUDIX domain-containing protein, partial [Candidatus Andersenbacteria bacterium]|nr:NUDIX domain-containing protein [Candidatus Andersenbacteria bacterium]